MLVTISRYSMPYEAQIAKSRLDTEGIPAFIADEHTINMQWLYSNALGGVRLQVPEPYVETALALLAEDREQDLTDQVACESEACPACGSTATEFFQIGRRWAFLMILGINFPLFPIKNGIRCKRCGRVSKT